MEYELAMKLLELEQHDLEDILTDILLDLDD